MRYDLEDLCDDIATLLKEKLNAKIEAISNEKADAGKSFDLPLIGENNYFFQSWDQKIRNTKVCIFYGIAKVDAQGIGPNTSESYQLFIEVVYTSSRTDTKSVQRILRYSRALKEVIEENWDELFSGNKLIVETLVPISFILDSNTSEEVRVGGVSIGTSLV